MEYRYLGDRFTEPGLKNRSCHAVRRADGKCIRGKNGSMLVELDGRKMVVMGRLLRKQKANEKALTPNNKNRQF